MKTHAKEYLQEFASSQDIWLKDLIYDTTETHGNVTSERRDEILDHLTTGTTLNSKDKLEKMLDDIKNILVDK